MRFYTGQHRYYCGIDLHARTLYVCIVDCQGKIRLHKRLRCEREALLRALEPYRSELVVGSECIFCWYWLADLCAREQIHFVLGQVKSRVVCKSERKLLDASVRLPWRPPSLSANVRETRSTQRIRVGRRQRKRTCWDCEREWKRMVVPLEPGRPSEARQLLRTRR